MKKSKFNSAIFVCTFFIVMFNAVDLITKSSISWMMNAIFCGILLILFLFSPKPKITRQHLSLGLKLIFVWLLFLSGISQCPIYKILEADLAALAAVSAIFAFITIMINRFLYYLGRWAST